MSGEYISPSTAPIRPPTRAMRACGVAESRYLSVCRAHADSSGREYAAICVRERSSGFSPIVIQLRFVAGDEHGEGSRTAFHG